MHIMARPAGPGAVEVGLHGVVAGLVEEPARRVPGVVAVPARPRPCSREGGAYGGQVGGDGLDALHQGVGGRELSSS